MTTENDPKREGIETTPGEEDEVSVIIILLVPEEEVAQIDALASRGRVTREEVLQRVLRRGLDKEAKAAAEQSIASA